MIRRRRSGAMGCAAHGSRKGGPRPGVHLDVAPQLTLVRRRLRWEERRERYRQMRWRGRVGVNHRPSQTPRGTHGSSGSSYGGASAGTSTRRRQTGTAHTCAERGAYLGRNLTKLTFMPAVTDDRPCRATRSQRRERRNHVAGDNEKRQQPPRRVPPDPTPSTRH